jgi:hypothetical protein
MLLLLGSASSSPTPFCWIYDKIYPVTEAAFKSQRLTPAQKKEIEKWAAPASPSQDRLVQERSPWTKPPSASEVRLLRWMRYQYTPEHVLVFVARPIRPEGASADSPYSPWIALNTNALIETEGCEGIHAYPPE